MIRGFDYSLFFVATLYDYYEASKDREALVELCLKRGLGLAKELERDQEVTFILEQIGRVTRGALHHLWDAKTSFFVSGVNKQVSWASQVWMALAGVLTR